MNKRPKVNLIFYKIIGVFTWICLLLAIVIFFVVFFTNFTNSDNKKAIFGYKFLIVNSDSMSKSNLSENESTFFDAGDIIIVKTKKDSKTYQVGEIITYISNSPESFGKTISHKIRKVVLDGNQVLGYVTYGINRNVNDTVTVIPENIIGYYVNKIPNVGNLLFFLKSTKGYYLTILIPSIILLIFFSIKFGRALTQKTLILKFNEELNSFKERISLLEQNQKRQTRIENQGELVEKAEVGQGVLNVGSINTGEVNVNNNGSNFALINNKKVSFGDRLLKLDKETQEYFNTLHNEFLSFKKISSRLSFKCISYRLGRTLLAKINVRGKTLSLYLNLNVLDFNKNVYFQKDMCEVKAYSEVPFKVKVKSERGKVKAVNLINVVADKFNLTKKDKFEKINILNLIKGE